MRMPRFSLFASVAKASDAAFQIFDQHRLLPSVHELVAGNKTLFW
jgi:hypothetical protein